MAHGSETCGIEDKDLAQLRHARTVRLRLLKRRVGALFLYADVRQQTKSWRISSEYN